MSGVYAYEDFYASHDHMPGSSRTLRVSGTVVFRTEGWSCRLERTEGNIGINPRILGLTLMLTPPDPGKGLPEVLTRCPVEWTEEGEEFEYDEVEFKVAVVSRQGPPRIPVEHPE